MSQQPYDVKRFRKALIHFIGGRAVQATARALLVLVLVRLLTIEDYGAYMLIVGLSEALLQVASFGILPVGQRYLPQLLTTLPLKELLLFVRTLIAAQMAILLLIAGALWKLWPAITPYIDFSAEQAVATQIGVSMFLLMPAFRFSTEMLEALLEQGKAQVARALMPLGRLLCIGVLMLADSSIGIENLLTVDIGVTFICLSIAWLFIQQSLGKLHSSSVTGVIPVREIMAFAWQMTIVGLMSSAGSPGALRLVLASAIGLAESGLFAFLQSLQRMVERSMPGTLLRGLVRPVLIARAFDTGNMNLLQAGLALLQKSNLLLVAAGSVLIGVSGNELVAVLSANKFSDGGLTLLLMYIALASSSQRTVIEMIMQITGQTKTLRLTAYIAPLALFSVWVVADLGLNAAIIIVMVFAAVANWIAMSQLVSYSSAFRIHWRGLFAIIVPAVLSIGGGIALRGVINPAVSAALALALYILLVWLAKPLRNDELNLIERSLGRRAGKLLQGFTGA
jgi:O-antigen/teichoic acid export membrane protein